MNYRTLGRTGLRVSEIALGTVSLGVDYGLPAPGEFGRPERRDAVRVIHAAADTGINLFDTAPAYGEAEALLGEALAKRDDCFIATKVSIPTKVSSVPLRDQIISSLENSLRALHRETLDLVQIHNATVEVLEAGEILRILESARRSGKVRFIGVSIYTDEEALAAVHTNAVDMIQIGYSILDQRKAKIVLPAARKHHVGVLTRSALLKGVLSSKAEHLPDEMAALKIAADRARQSLKVSWNDLPTAAVRFCVDSPGIDSVLIGPRTEQELKQSLEVIEMPRYDASFMKEAEHLGLTDERLVNPALWPVK
jgi:aryl-alcohol dehydrogenase-like predicted oxidoreductase